MLVNEMSYFCNIPVTLYYHLFYEKSIVWETRFFYTPFLHPFKWKMWCKMEMVENNFIDFE